MSAKFVSILPLLLMSSLLLGVCSADDESGVAANFEVGEGQRELNLYGPELDEDEDLQMVELANELGDILTSSQEATSQEAPAAQAPEEKPWREPKNDMSLVRFFHGLYYQGQYARINEYLIREVNSTSVEANMVKVLEWLDREKKRGVSLLNKATVEALEQLASLNEIYNGQNQCNRDSYTALYKNDRATKGRAHMTPSALGPPRRIDAVVHQVMMKHAIDCFNVYPETFADIRANKLDQNHRQVVESFLDAIIGDPNAVSSKVKAITGKMAAVFAYNTIRVQAIDDPNLRYLGRVVDERRGRLWVDGEQVRNLVRTYLVQPCQSYLNALGPDVILPARFDAKMLEREDRYTASSKPMIEFMHGYIHFRLCELLTRRDEPQLAKSLVAYIEAINK